MNMDHTCKYVHIDIYMAHVCSYLVDIIHRVILHVIHVIYTRNTQSFFLSYLHDIHISVSRLMYIVYDIHLGILQQVLVVRIGQQRFSFDQLFDFGFKTGI